MPALMTTRARQESRIWKKRCGLCGATFDRPAWSALTRAGTIEHDAIQAHLDGAGPDVIELRACTCGKILAVAGSSGAID
jgi:hypothetical protein